MPRIIVVSVAVAVLLLGASQLLVPPLAEREVEQRLERDGGEAEVELGVFPALRLLFGDGGSLEVEGRGLRLDPRAQEDALDRIDGFDEVRISLDDVEAGPFDVDSFELLRDEGERDYRMRLTGTTSGREVARFLGSEAGGPLGAFLGDLAAGSLPATGAEVPMRLRAIVHSSDGRVETRAVRGSVAGIPAGPFARLVVEAVVRRL
jgi:hypothetical protein